MSESDWIDKAVAQVMQYLPNMHPHDAVGLAADLQRSWPGLQPADAVRYFFRPHLPQGGGVEPT